MANPFLLGEHVYLRALLETDAEGDYPLWLNDEEVCRGNSHHRFAFTPESARDYIRRAGSTRDELILAIALRDDDRHIGNITLKRMDFVSRSAEFAIIIGAKDCWGKGHSKEAARLLLDHAFFTLNLNRVYCGTFETNVAMKKLAEYLAMQVEGQRRQAVFKQNRYVDVIEYGVLRQEYIERFGGSEER